MNGLVTVDSATRLAASARGSVAVCGSHGALYTAWLAARARVRAVVFNDAGIGRHGAGIAGLAWLDGFGIAACAIDYRSARIGDAKSMLEDGVVSASNDTAAALGCLPGHKCREVARLLANAPEPAPMTIPEIGQTRLRISNSGHREVWAIDSVSLAKDSDRRAILVTGSHGGLLGGHANDGILDVDVFAAFFSDAGGGKDDAGNGRLPVLEARGIAAATVSCHTARIGDGRSTYDTGVIVRLNSIAARLDVKEGMSMREAVARLVGLG